MRRWARETRAGSARWKRGAASVFAARSADVRATASLETWTESAELLARLIRSVADQAEEKRGRGSFKEFRWGVASVSKASWIVEVDRTACWRCG
ncbi:hypothetical protein EUGRSUZ_K00601 [Eucalyptus grandis]|uniref:Uncharacterized protein n=2 Tax=Eucalyptus grandis TaxID=71139 RepID=A0ACC3IRE4_EUCGR|nr:hypothetical protein EUGRSUZ_K00601 [Eucalyptus grandis]